ncbi:hypothetical protein HQ308_16855 [Rhodococcus sp. BP-241]|uniref:hypothetical protein n=1 Tax=Rhodococcus sp. BP-241 TaxID=2739441 RepID=UPI001C9AA627|nr:hypothetical protein [Rhodococcus sp. BP-241]MBY6708472.1 hypothetical protein [Rhodococcus sp. BP-241]
MTSKPTTIVTPADLEASGARMWEEIAGTYMLRPDELRVLEDSCREADLIEDLRSESRGAQMVVKGSMGQPVINPLISELRQHRACLAGLLRQLKLPDEDAPASTNPARKAAHARWKNRSS